MVGNIGSMGKMDIGSSSKMWFRGVNKDLGESDWLRVAGWVRMALVLDDGN